MRGARGRRAQVVEHEVPARHRVDGVGSDVAEAQLARDLSAVDVEVHARQRAGAQRQAPGFVLGERKPPVVAREHPEVRQQVVPEVHGLRPLQVGVAGHGPVGVLLGARQQRAHQRRDRRLGSARSLARVHRQVGRDLVVARTRCVQPSAHRPRDLRQSPLDRHVDVLVALLEREALLAQLALDRVEPRQQRVAVRAREDAAIGQHARVCARLGQVLWPQAPVKRKRGVEPVEIGMMGLIQARHGRPV